jgi:hypothetical protein
VLPLLLVWCVGLLSRLPDCLVVVILLVYYCRGCCHHCHTRSAIWLPCSACALAKSIQCRYCANKYQMRSKCAALARWLTWNRSGCVCCCKRCSKHSKSLHVGSVLKIATRSCVCGAWSWADHVAALLSS